MRYIEIMNPYGNIAALSAFQRILPNYFHPESSSWELLGACDDEGEILGIIAFEDIVSECRIHWLYVVEHARGYGVASHLVDALLKIYIEDGLFKPLVATFPADNSKEMEALKGFFEEDDRFDVDFECEKIRISSQSMMKSEKFVNLLKKGSKAETFDSLPDFQKREYYKAIDDQGYFSVLDKNRWKEKCVSDLCLCVLNNNIIQAIIFVTKQNDSTFEISFLNGKEPRYIFLLLRAVASTFMKNYQGYDLVTEPLNPVAMDLLKYIFPEYQVEGNRYKAEWNFDPGMKY